jgi:NADH dehydrogenase
MILVIGATGMVGGEICRLLRAAGRPVRALIRSTADSAKKESLAQLGASLVQGDLRDRQSLRAACEGVNAVITTASAMPFAYQPGENTPQTTDQDGNLSLIAAAHEAGVQQFVYTSFAPMVASFPLQDAKRAVEARLRGSGLSYTILQPSFFMEAWLGPMVGFDYPNRKAKFYGTGENPISWISFLDVARFAVACLDNSAARNASLELGGPAALSPLQVVKIFENAGGAPFEVQHVPVEVLQGRLAAAEDPMQKSFTGLMISYAAGQPIDMSSTLRSFPFELKTVEEYARSVMG